MSGSFDSGDIWSGHYYVRVYGNWTDEPSNNRSYVNVYAQYGGASGWWFAGHQVTGNLSVNGGAVVGYSGQYSMAGAGSRNQLTGWSGYINHNASNGSGSFSTSVTFGMVNQGYSYSMPVITASSGGTFTDYNHSANVPYFDDIRRATDGNIGQFYTHFARTGNVNGYGGTSYSLERATNQAMTGYSNFSEGSLSDYDQYSAYFFRMYAAGPEGGWIRANGGNGDGTWGPYYGRPYAPGWTKALRSSTTEGKIDLEWATPSNSGNSGYGSLQYYHIYRDGSYLTQVTGNSFADTGLTKGSTHYYEIYALGSSYWSPVSQSTYTYLGNKNIMAPGVPSAPTFVTGTTNAPNPSRVGRNLTVKANLDSNFYGNTSTDYRIQYAKSSDNYATWYGWNGTADVLDGYNDISSGSYTYSMFTPATTYKFRIYAVNSVGTGEKTTTSTGFFLPASGRRWTGTEYAPTSIAKRYDSFSGKWVDISIAKRYSTAANGGLGGWVDLT